MEHTLIIGLGNPDPTLQNTYHNLGMLAVESLASDLSKEVKPVKFRANKGLFSYAKIGKQTFVKPLVFMNESGLAVKEAMRVFNAKPNNIVVIHDDSDITVGNVKYSSGGGSAGHKGISSIIQHINTNEFSRIRIGIRENNETRKKAEEFVLSPITAKDHQVFKEIFSSLSLEG
jgi:PTH1 family peptidyl-tRNA hydrolase